PTAAASLLRGPRNVCSVAGRTKQKRSRCARSETRSPLELKGPQDPVPPAYFAATPCADHPGDPVPPPRARRSQKQQPETNDALRPTAGRLRCHTANAVSQPRSNRDG